MLARVRARNPLPCRHPDLLTHNTGQEGTAALAASTHREGDVLGRIAAGSVRHDDAHTVARVIAHHECNDHCTELLACVYTSVCLCLCVCM